MDSWGMEPRPLLPLVLGASVAWSGAGCHSPESDFQRLCEVATSVVQDGAIDRPEKQAVIHQRFTQTAMSRRTHRCVRLVFESSLDVSAKYPILEQCARDAGALRWTCPALKTWWGSAPPPVEILP
jgi:hypothetical protein